MSVEASHDITQKALTQLDTIQQFAMDPNIHDHHLALQTMHRYCILLPERDLRTVFLDKVARFTAHFGYMPEIRSMQADISDGMIPSLHHGRGRNSVSSCVLQARCNIDTDHTLEDRSVFGNILYSIEEQCKRPNMATRYSSSRQAYESSLDSSYERRSPALIAVTIQERQEPMDSRLGNIRITEETSSDSSDKQRISRRSVQPIKTGVEYIKGGRSSSAYTQDSGYHSPHSHRSSRSWR